MLDSVFGGMYYGNAEQRMSIESIAQAGAPSLKAGAGNASQTLPPAEARLWDVLVAKDVDDV